MKLFLLAVSLFSVSCAPLVWGPPACVTPCGVRVMNLPLPNPGQPEVITCESIAEAEAVLSAALKAHTTDARLHQLCDPTGISGWRMQIRQEVEWLSDNTGRPVAGETYCSTQPVMLIDNWTIEHTSYAHEMVHALQDCQPLGPFNEGDYFHSNWERDGVYKAIGEVWKSGHSRLRGGVL